MICKNIVVDGQGGIVKWAVIKAVQENLHKNKIQTRIHQLTLLDYLVDSSRLKAVKKSTSEAVHLLDTNHIFELVNSYYGTKKIPHYSVFSQALDMAWMNLRPDLVVLIDSLDKSEQHQEVRRGYFWEARQRDYLVISAVSDVEKALARIDQVINPTSIVEEPVLLKTILRKKRFKKSKKTKSHQNHISKKS